MTVVTVSTVDQLYDALAAASGGDTIKLEAGYYGDVNLSSLSYSSAVTIESADTNDPAVFNTLKVTNSANLTFDSLEVDFVPDAETLIFDNAVEIRSSSGITVTNSILEGGDSVAGDSPDIEPGTQGDYGILGLPVGRAITVIDGTDIEISNNDISEFMRGIVMAEVDGAVVSGNDVYNLRISPLVGADLDNVTVSDNIFRDSTPWKLGGAGDHADYIHFWTTATQTDANTNITISNNMMVQGDGQALVGVYLEDSFGKTFSNVTIVDNVINNDDAQVLRLEYVDGGLIARNTFVYSGETYEKAPNIGLHDYSRNLTITDNVLSGIIGASAESPELYNIVTANNLYVDYIDTSAPNYIGNLFFEGTPKSDGVTQLLAIPGSAADGVGAAMTQYDAASGELTAVFQTYATDTDYDTLVFDACDSAGAAGATEADNATFRWDFGDGTTATGTTVQKTYSEPGFYNVTLTITDKDGKISQASSVAGVAGSEVVSYNEDTGKFELNSFGLDTALGMDGLQLNPVNDKFTVSIGPGVETPSIPQAALSPMFGADNFDMTITIRAMGGADAGGELFRVHPGIIVAVSETGKLEVKMNTDTDTFSGTSKAGNLLDGLRKEIRLDYDDTTDSLDLYVDGVLDTTFEVSGLIPDTPRDLTFGDPWGNDTFNGRIIDFSLNVDAPSYPAFNGTHSAGASGASAAEDCAIDGTTGGGGTGTIDNGSLFELPDFAEFDYDLAKLNRSKLRDDATVETTGSGAALLTDGEADFAVVGRLKEFEADGRLAISVDFDASADPTGGNERLVWKVKSFGLLLDDGALELAVMGEDDKFKFLKTGDLGLEDGEINNAVVLMDDVQDRIQLFVDGALVLDETDIAFDIGNTTKWKLGGSTKKSFEGEISEFAIDTEFDFYEDSSAILG